jgi:hypothetical protein
LAILLSVFFRLTMLLSVFRSTSSNYPLGIFKLILNTLIHLVF